MGHASLDAEYAGIMDTAPFTAPAPLFVYQQSGHDDGLGDSVYNMWSSFDDYLAIDELDLDPVLGPNMRRGSSPSGAANSAERNSPPHQESSRPAHLLDTDGPNNGTG